MIAIFVVCFLGLAAWLGWYLGREDNYGGWANRLTHSCGWFKDYRDWPSYMQTHKPCPRCGKSDGDWKYRVGRPTFPFGWEWKED